jgi:carbonic anhydrase/acetyltransferase-like protein (isoleucine patch superfamily)
MEDRKYKLVRQGVYPFGERWGKYNSPVYRIKALRDIPLYGVLKGDLGGYVTKAIQLSHQGNCWIGPEARALGSVEILDDAYISDKAVVSCDVKWRYISISGTSKVSGNAELSIEAEYPIYPENNTIISGKVHIFDHAEIINAGVIYGDIDIHGKSRLHSVSEITGDAEICDYAELHGNITVAGKTKIGGFIEVSKNCIIMDSTLTGAFRIEAGNRIENCQLDDNGYFVDGILQDIKSSPSVTVSSALKPLESINDAITNVDIGRVLTKLNQLHDERLRLQTEQKEMQQEIQVSTPVIEQDEKKAAINDALLLLMELNEKSNSYETDIVKLIKYPVMADKGCDTTAHMHASLGKANRMSRNPAHAGFVDAVNKAEKAFLAAESHALKMASTGFTELENKKVSKAKDLLAIAANEASTEHEKKVAFGQAFKQLEGVIAVPEIAVETFRVKIGLKELQA